MIPDREPEERFYEEVKSVDSFHQIVEQYLEDYNNVHKTHMNLVIFRWSILPWLRPTLYTVWFLATVSIYRNAKSEGVGWQLVLYIRENDSLY